MWEVSSASRGSGTCEVEHPALVGATENVSAGRWCSAPSGGSRGDNLGLLLWNESLNLYMEIICKSLYEILFHR